jgi:hypothetical protein
MEGIFENPPADGGAAAALSRVDPFPRWTWRIPERFNIGVACTDAHLGTPVASGTP